MYGHRGHTHCCVPSAESQGRLQNRLCHPAVTGARPRAGVWFCLAVVSAGIAASHHIPTQHTASNYCTALPVCSPGPVPTAQRQGVNTALLTVHTARARRHVLYTKHTSTQRRNFTWLHTMDLLFPRPSVPNSPDGQFAAYSIMYAYK